jgi:hypothetical protein
MTRTTRFLVAATAVASLGVGMPLAQQTTPTPQSVIGFEPCADYKLATYEQIADYFRRLATAVPQRMQLVEIGKTAEGRVQLMAVISSEQNIRQLARYKEISRAMAHARRSPGGALMSDDEARQLAREGKAVVWIDFGLHSSEVAHAQTAPLMAFKAVTEESDEMKFIRDNVVFLLVPNMNPDGTTLVAEWYRQNIGRPWEGRPPELWQKYVGHDNNRDWFMMNQPETRNSARQLYAEWFPQIIYNQHQTAPFPARIFVPPFDDPMNPNIPPLVMRGVNLVGDSMTRRLDQEGKRGAISRIGFDTWWNGGMRTAPYFHNMVGILTETGHASATPATYDAKAFPKTFPNTTIPTLEPTTYYPSPFTGGEWHLRNSCDYMVTASMAVLDVGAKRRAEWLFDTYQMARDAVVQHGNETFLVPADQWDPGTTARMINVLRLGGVEVERATEAFSAGGRQYGAGTFVIRGAQPFEPYVKDLLTAQVYPDMRLYPGGPPKRPYDITGWTLPFQMGVTVDRVVDRVSVPTANVDVAPAPRGSVPAVTGGQPHSFAIDPRANDAFIAVNRLLKAGALVYRSVGPVRVGGEEWPAGTFLVSPSDVPQSKFDWAATAQALGLKIGAGPTDHTEAWQVRPPRIGVYHAWGGNMDEGWTRWILEQFEFPYTSIHDGDLRAGSLRASYDVIVLPDATYDQMLNGLAPGSMPPQFTGGMTARGVANLFDFTAAGGTLVAMDRAAELPLTTFGLPIRNVTANVAESTLYVPGTILRIKVDPTNPVAFGMPADAAAFFINSPAFAIGRRPNPFALEAGLPESDVRPDGIHVVAEYPSRDLLMSGWLLGERVLTGRAAVIEASVEKGRVVLLGFRTQHRGQPHGTFKLLFNSLLLGASEKSANPKLSSGQ